MGYQEKKNILVIVMHVLITIGYFGYVATQYTALVPEADLLTFWAKAIVIMAPLYAVMHLVAIFIFTAIHKQLTGEGFPKFIDERDKLIELKSLRVEYFVVIFSIFASMLSVLMGATITTTFVVLITGMLLSGFLAPLIRFMLYRADT